MPVPVQDIRFSELGSMNEITTIHDGVGWPADAENDPFTPPISRVAQLIRNPHVLGEQNV